MRRNGLVLVIADLGSGGAQQVVSHLANAWASRGRRVAVITFSAPETNFFILDREVEHISLDGAEGARSASGRIVANLRRIAALRRALRAFDGDTAIGFIAQTNVLLIAAAAGLRCRVVISERNDPARQSFGPAWDALRRWFYRRADLVTANSHAALETLREYVPDDRLMYVPNPLRATTELRQGRSRQERIVLNVGRLHWQKGQDVLIRAFATAAGDLSGWRLVIIGEGPDRAELEELATQLGVGERVDMPGTVPDPFPWYGRARLFALPSRLEGTPNALMEAMACGLPCVVSGTSGGALELIEDGVTGVVVPGEDEAGLAAAIVRLAGAPEQARTLGAAAARRVSAHRPKAALRTWDEALARAGQSSAPHGAKCRA